MPAHTLTASTGEWHHAPATYHYQWKRCAGETEGPCEDIYLAKHPTYLVTDADRNSSLKVTVTATSSGGAAARDSDRTRLVTDPVAS
jgi:hypothetical protein